MDRTPSFSQKLAALAQRGRGRAVTVRGAHVAAEAAEDLAAKRTYLRETEVFAALTASEQDWLSHNATMISCDAGRVFYTPDEPGEVVYILKRGAINLYRLAPDGRKLVVARLDAHTVFGEMDLIGQAMYGCFAEAAEESLLCVLSRSDLTTLIRSNPDVALSLMAEMGKRLHEREAQLEAFAFRAVPARLASFLLDHADPDGTVAGFSHEEIAQQIGTYRETVSQALGRFRADGWVTVEPRRITVRDQRALRALVDR